MKKIAEKVLERSQGQCEVCGMRGNEMHHLIKGRGKRKEHQSADSVMLLCFECHRGTKGIHGRDGRELDVILKRQLQETYKEQGYSESETRELMGGRLY